MKKAYVKPVMESEAFVANEYVAACATIACVNCSASKKVYEEAATVKNGLTSMTEGTGLEVFVYPDSFVAGANDQCTSVNDTRKPKWIDDICTAENWSILRAGWEETVYFFYKLLGGSDDIEVSTYHPVEVVAGHKNHPYASV